MNKSLNLINRPHVTINFLKHLAHNLVQRAVRLIALGFCQNNEFVAFANQV